jgi:hypothetical protein
MYLKNLGEKNENTRFAASRAGSVLGGLLCGMHSSPKEPKEEALEPLEDLDEIRDTIQDLEIEELEEDEITFVGDSESQFFNYLKQAGSQGQEDANTVATSAVEAAGSVYSSAKTSYLS